MPPSLTIDLVNQRSEIARLGRLVDEFGAANGIPADVLFNVNLALDEVVTNIIRHGYDDDRSERRIGVVLELAGNTLLVTVTDDGKPFDPLQIPPVDVEAAIEHRPIGGLGIHLVRSLMDSLEYRRDTNRNVLLMKCGAGL
jgi:serine/threonine-protein kinase RsbW